MPNLSPKGVSIRLYMSSSRASQTGNRCVTPTLGQCKVAPCRAASTPPSGGTRAQSYRCITHENNYRRLWSAFSLEPWLRLASPTKYLERRTSSWADIKTWRTAYSYHPSTFCGPWNEGERDETPSLPHPALRRMRQGDGKRSCLTIQGPFT